MRLKNSIYTTKTAHPGFPIFYEGINVGTRRVDFLVEGKVLVELKALIQLEDVHLAQALNYLEAFQLNLGLLINFGGRRLEFKRLAKTNNHSIIVSEPGCVG